MRAWELRRKQRAFIAPFSLDECVRRLGLLHDDTPTNTSGRSQAIKVKVEQPFAGKATSVGFKVNCNQSGHAEPNIRLLGLLKRVDDYNTQVEVSFLDQWRVNGCVLLVPLPPLLIWLINLQASLYDNFVVVRLFSCMMMPATLLGIMYLVTLFRDRRQLMAKVQSALFGNSGFGHGKLKLNKGVSARSRVYAVAPFPLDDVIERLKGLNEKVDPTSGKPAITVDVKNWDVSNAVFTMHYVIDKDYWVAAEIAGELRQETNATTIVDGYAHRPFSWRTLYMLFALCFLLVAVGYSTVTINETGYWIIGIPFFAFILYAGLRIIFGMLKLKSTLVKQLKEASNAVDVEGEATT